MHFSQQLFVFNFGLFLHPSSVSLEHNVWVLTDEVVQVYEILHLLLANGKLSGRTPLRGGNFNACVGLMDGHDYVDQKGPYGMGSRNQRGNDCSGDS